LIFTPDGRVIDGYLFTGYSLLIVIPTVHIKHTNMFYMSTVVNADDYGSEVDIPSIGTNK